MSENPENNGNPQQSAAWFRKRGWQPIPTRRRSKAPKLPEGHEFLSRKATDEEFAAFDFSHGVGVVTGQLSGVIVLDDDDGQTIKERGWHVPLTPTVKTKRGHQYYFACPAGGLPTFDVAEKLEVRGDGAYVLAPPSVHPSGQPYDWVISPEEVDLADPPAWLLEKARSRDRRLVAEDVGESIPHGSRNKTLFSIAGSLRRRGLDEVSMAAALLGINATKCETPLPEDEVRQIAHSAARYEPAAQLGEDGQDGHAGHTTPDGFNLTDLGNARRLVARHGNDLRYCHPWRKWLVWDTKRWKIDDTAEVERRAVKTVASIYAEAANASDKDERKAIAAHAKASEARSRIEAMIALARSLPGVPLLPEALDQDVWALKTEPGTIDLRTGALRRHRRSDLISKIAPVDYDPQATAPTFERFLEKILPTEAVRGFLQRSVGYAATGSTTEEMLPILHGTGANGKTTLTGALMDALGDYAAQAPPDLLMVKKDSHPTELADLFGARFVVCMENEEGRRLAESLVKQLTGRDKIKARRMREDFWQFDPTHTVFLGTNHRPEVRGTDHAIWRRLKLVPFDVAIPEHEQDKGLPEKLRGELAGILAWIVRGCLAYQHDGLGEPEQVTQATAGYRSEMDTLAAFIDDECVRHYSAEVPASPLYNAYQDWCADNGERPETQKRFGMRLRERGFESFTFSSGAHRGRKGWRGIGLRDNRPDDGPDGPPDDPPDGLPGVDDQYRATESKRHQDAERIETRR